MKRGKREIEEHRRIDRKKHKEGGTGNCRTQKEVCGTDREDQSVMREQGDGEAS